MNCRGLRVRLEDSVVLFFLSPVWRCKGGLRSFISREDVWIVFDPCLILRDFRKDVKSRVYSIVFLRVFSNLFFPFLP